MLKLDEIFTVGKSQELAFHFMDNMKDQSLGMTHTSREGGIGRNLSCIARSLAYTSKGVFVPVLAAFRTFSSVVFSTWTGPVPQDAKRIDHH